MSDRIGSGVRYSIVVPVFDEEAIVPILLHRLDLLLDALDGPDEVIFVDDGSRDTGPIVLRAKAKADPRYRFIGLSRNFGHQIAITAGLDAALGQAVIIMDADLQDPPEVVLQLVECWKQGFQIVDAKRVRRQGETVFKRAAASVFYRVLNHLAGVKVPRDVGDFRLVDRAVVDAFNAMPERDRFVRGMFAWLGFRHTTVSYERAPRAAGTTKYPLRKMIRLATDAIVGFSDVPLRTAIWVGLSVSALATFYGIYVVASWMAGSHFVEGWASTIVVLSLLSGLQMLMTGIVGLYIGRIHAEVKRRPLYIVDTAAAGRTPAAHASWDEGDLRIATAKSS